MYNYKLVSLYDCYHPNTLTFSDDHQWLLSKLESLHSLLHSTWICQADWRIRALLTVTGKEGIGTKITTIQLCAYLHPRHTQLYTVTKPT